MKVAHMVVVTPNRCGLYETTRELVKGLRLLGVDSRMVEPLPDNPIGWKGESDRGVPVSNLKWAAKADIIVSHSGVRGFEDKPIIQMAHGRPRHSFITERDGNSAVYTHHYNVNNLPQYKAVVTLWPQHKHYLEVLYTNKLVHLIPPPVDLEYYIPGEGVYDFTGKGGGTNIVITDTDRADVDSFVCLHAYALWARENSNLNPKLQFFTKPNNLKGLEPVIRTIQNDGHMGMLVGWVKGLQHVYRSAALTLTGHEIDVRTVRESMACGCPVVKMTKLNPGWITQGLNQNRKLVRAMAEKQFDPARSAKALKEIIKQCLL